MKRTHFSIFFLVGCITFFGLLEESLGLPYPVTTPAGEIPGGTYRSYFDNMFPGCGTIGEVIRGFDSSGVPICIAPTSAGFTISGSTLGSTLYYDGSAWRASENIYNSGSFVGVGGVVPQSPFEVVAGANSYLHMRRLTNVGLGQNSLNRLTTGEYNVGLGHQALFTNTTGFFNIGIGSNALYSNTTGMHNVSLGHLSLYSNTTGNFNIALGQSALNQNNIGLHNIALGQNALFSNTTGINNISIGQNSSFANQTGSGNVAIGFEAGHINTNGNYNTAIGYSAVLPANGSGNILLGYNTRLIGNVSNGLNIGNSIFGSNIGLTNNQIFLGTGSLTTSSPSVTVKINGNLQISGSGAGSGKILISKDANGLAEWGDVFASNVTSSGVIGGSGSYGYLVKFGSGGIGLDLSTLYETGGFLGIGTTNPRSFIEIAQSGALYMHFRGANTVALGKFALNTLSGGINNTALGYGSLSGNITGNYNIAIGSEALNRTTNSVNNIALGSQALYNTLSGTENVAIGRNTLFSNTVGSFNTALGSYALSGNTIGQYNIGFGYQSLAGNTIGSSNIAFGYQSLQLSNGDYNIGIGKNTLSNNTSSNNIAIGDSSLYYNTSGQYNIGLGYRTLYTNTSGVYNVGIGYQSLYTNTTGNRNVAIGYTTMLANTSGYDNVAIGVEAMRDNTIGYENVAVGDSALAFNVTGNRNTAVGNHALYNNVSGLRNTAVGNYALFTNSSGAVNTALGRRALYFNTVGNRNIGIGDQAAYLNTSGADNIAIGNDALYNNTGGSENIAIGLFSLANAYSGRNTAVGPYTMNWLQGGEKNLALGASAMRYVTGSSSDNIAIGQNALQGRYAGTSTFSRNIGIGSFALYQITTGGDNIGIGNEVGTTLTTGSNNILIGSGVNTPTATSSNTLNIGNWIYGNGGKIGIGTGALSGVARLVVDGQVQITGGSPGSGRVLVSDSGGTAIWMPASSLDGVGGFNFPGDTDYASIDVVDKRGPNQSDMVFQLGDDGEFAQDRFVFQLDGYTGWPGGQPVPPCEFYTSKSGNNLKRCRYNGLTQRYPLIMDGTQALFFSQMAAGTGNYFSGATAGNNPPNKALGFGSGGGFSSALFFLDGDGKRVGIGTINPRATLEIDSGVANFSGLRFTRLNNTSPLFTSSATTPVGVNGSGELVPVQGGMIPVYTGLGGSPNAAINDGTNPPTIGANYDRYFNVAARQSFVVTDVGGSPYNCPEFQTGSVNKGATGCNQSPWATYVMTAQNATSGNRYGYQILISDRVDAPFVVRGGMYSSASGTLMNTSMTTPSLWFKAITVPTNRSDWFYINPGVDQNNNPIAGGGNIGIGTMNPAYKLNIVDGNTSFRIGAAIGATTDAFLQLRSQSSSNWTRIGTNGSSLVFLTQGTDETSTSPAMFVGNNGRVGIGGINNPSTTLEVGGQVKINGGSPGSGKVLVSDVNGLASWSNVAPGVSASGITGGSGSYLPKFGAGGNGLILSSIYDNGSRVGIGTTSATSRFEIWSGATSVFHMRGTNNIGIGLGSVRPALSGNANTGFGHESLFTLTTGYSNSAFGHQALRQSTAGFNNSAFGKEAMYNDGDGTWNTAIGYQALRTATSSDYNVAIGGQALYTLGTGQGNVAIGHNALYGATTTTSNNTAIGYMAGSGITTGQNNILIGYGAQAASSTASNQLNIGNWIYGNGGNIGIGIAGSSITAKLTLDSGTNNVSGLRMSRLTHTSPTATGSVVGLGVDSAGNVVPISNGDVVVYDGIGRNGTAPNPNPDVPNRRVGYDFNRYFAIPTKQSFVVSDGNGAGYNAPYFKEDGVSGICSWGGAGGTSPYDCATADPYTGISASPNNSFTMTARGDNYGYQIALGARGDAPLFARSGKWYNGTTNYASGLYLANGTTPSPWQKVLTVPANHIEYFYVNIGYNSQLQEISGGGNIGMGTSTPDMRLVLAYSGSTGSTSEMMRIERGLKGADGNMVNAYGTPYLMIGGPENRTNSIQTIGFGYNTGGSSQPAEIGLITTNTAGNTLGDLIFATRSVTTNTAPSERMRITANGNVGIGNTAPNAPLQFANTTQNRKITLYETANNDHQYYGLGINASTLRYQVDSTTANHIFYAASSSTTSNELMRIAGNGNIGIGTTGAPSAKLDVRGTIKLGTNGNVLNNIIKTSVVADIPSIAANSSFTATVAVAGAMVGSSVIFSPQNALADGLVIQYTRVSAANTVEAKFRNTTGVAIDPPSMNYYISLIQ